MTKTLFWVLMSAAVATAPGSVFAAPAKGDSCTLSDGVKVSAKPKGKGKKKKVDAGAEVTVLAVKKGWVQIKAGKTKGWIKDTSLEELCQTEAAEPPPADPAEADEPAAGADAPPADDGAAGTDTGDSMAPAWAADDAAGDTAAGGGEAASDGGADTTSDGGGSGYADDEGDAGSKAASKDAFLQAGGGLVFGTKGSDLGLHAEAFVNLGSLLPHLRAGGSLEYWFVSGATAISFNGDVHYLFDIADGLRVYPLAGLLVAHARASAGGQTFSATEIGLNIGGGGEYDLGFAKVYAETKYTLIDGAQLVLGGGIRFGF